MSWAEDKVREYALMVERADKYLDFDDLTRAIRETIEKCAAVVEQAGGEDHAIRIRKLGED